jgi:hypothetical protein
MFGYAGGAVLAVLLATAAVQLLLFHGRGGSSVGYVRQHGHRGAASAGAISGFGGPAGHRDGQSGPRLAIIDLVRSTTAASLCPESSGKLSPRQRGDLDHLVLYLGMA